MMKKVYICAPHDEDLEKVARYVAYAFECDAAPYAPQQYAQALDVNNLADRQKMKSAGMSHLLFAEELWVFGEEVTQEMKDEICLAKSMKLKIKPIRIGEGNEFIGGKKK